MKDASLEPEVIAQGLVLRDAPPLWVLTLVILPAVCALVILAYRRGSQGVPLPMRGLLIGLRILVLLFIAFLLMDPAMETLVIERKPTLNLLLIDSSASMAKKDDYATSPNVADAVREAAQLPTMTPLEEYERIQLVERTLGASLPDQRSLDSLVKDKRLKLYRFGERLQPLDSAKELTARDRVTMLGRSLEAVFEEPEVKSAAIGSIILVSDGKNTAGPAPSEVLDALSRRRVPVHTIGVGDPRALQDVEIANVLHSSVLLLEDTATFEVALRQQGYDGQRFELRLLDDEIPLASQSFNFGQDQEIESFTLLYKVPRIGRFSWTLEVRPLPGEHSKDNNRRKIDVTVKDAKIRVLYVESLPRYEYRKLMAFLTRAPEAFLTQCLLLDASLGFPQERTEGLPGLERFPRTREELFAYDVILFGDVDPNAQAFSGGDPKVQEELFTIIEEFVANGGGLGFLSGDRFVPRAYKDTRLGDLLPVLLDPNDEPFTVSDRGFKVRLTELGKSHPIMQIDQREGDPEWNTKIWEERGRLEFLEEHFGFARVKGVKPGAVVLAGHESERERSAPLPIHVVMTYGEGQVFFTAVDDCWRWFKWQGAFSYHRFFGNVVRHLARARLFRGDLRYQLFANKTRYQVGESVTLTAWIKDRTYLPSNAETQTVLLMPPGAAAQRQTLALRRVQPGQFVLSFVASEIGEYQAWIPGEDDLEDERYSPLTFLVEASDAERKEPILDAQTLREIAERTGGRTGGLNDLRPLLSEAATGSVEIPRQRRYTHLRDGESPFLPWLPAAFVVLLTAEWLLRKRFRYL